MPDPEPIQLTEAQIVRFPTIAKILEWLGAMILILNIVLLVFEGTTFQMLRTLSPNLYALLYPWPYVWMIYQTLISIAVWLFSIRLPD